MLAYENLAFYSYRLVYNRLEIYFILFTNELTIFNLNEYRFHTSLDFQFML